MNTDKPVLILSESLDYHGLAVKWGLERLGVSVDWWERAEFPQNQTISSWISTAGSKLVASGSHISFERDRYATIWNRRGQIPRASKLLHHTDQVVARNEATHVLGGLQSTLADANPRALQVNAFESARSASQKVYQLYAAQTVGFDIPETLISNCPDDIRVFFNTHEGKIIAKQQIPFAWRTRSRSLLVTGTAKVCPEHLTNDEALSACPMIYQKQVDMRNELRVIVFGRSALALNQIRKSIPSSGFFDIRYESVDKSKIEVDSNLSSLCYAYMDKLGLTYAAIDVAQTWDGGFIFLEANEAGQFLFLEEQAPSIPMLDAFCQYLASADPAFVYRTTSGLKLLDFEKTEEARQFHARYQNHMEKSELTSPFELVE